MLAQAGSICVYVLRIFKKRVHDAVAEHSVRKILYNPALQIATAGYTREKSWIRRWNASYTDPNTVSTIIEQVSHPEVQRVLYMRSLHVLGLFCLLPAHINNAIGYKSQTTESRLVEEILLLLPVRKRPDVLYRPGKLVHDILNLIDTSGEHILGIADGILRERTSRINL